MKKTPKTPKKDKNLTPTTAAQSDTNISAGVNAPQLDPKTLDVGIRSIKDGAQAYAAAQGLEVANETRNKKNAIIWRKYNGDPPFDQEALEAEGEDWRSNASFGFLSGIVSRVTPAPVQIIDSARYLTSSSLAAKTAEAATKSETFRNVISKAIRQWDGWKSFNYALSQEDVLMGAAFAAWLDDDDPFPRFFRLDEAFVPDGTLQQSKSVQLFVAKQPWLINEAVDFIKDGKDIATAANWDVDAMVETINSAMPNNPARDSTAAGHARQYEDLVREGNIGTAYTTGAKAIQVYQVLAVEADGQVTHYIVDRLNSHKVLYQKDDRFKSMQDQLVLFTLEPGNGKFYSSKGLGRMLVNMHISIERTRNVTIDNIYLAGLMVLQADPNKAPNIQTKLTHPFILTTTDATFVEQKIDANITEFLELDSKMTQLAEISAGAYIPDKLSASGERDKTATEASIDANREAQAKIAFLSRFWGQFADVISNIQKKLCNPESTNDASKKVMEQLKEAGLTTEEIDELANCPAAEVVQDMTQTQNSQKVAVFEALKGDPKADQNALYKMGVTAMATPEVAAEVLIPEEFDQTVEAEAVRLQLLESSAMMDGNSINVSPRDNHKVHLDTVAGQLKQDWPGVKEKAAKAPNLLDGVNLAMVHAKAHITTWEQLGAKPEDVAPYQKALDMLEKDLTQTAQAIQQQKAQAQEAAQQQPPQQGGPQQPGQPTAQPLPMTQELLIAWLKEYPNLPDDEKRKLETLGGLGASKVGAVGNSTMTQEQARRVDHVVQSVGAMHAAANTPRPPMRPQQMPPPPTPQPGPPQGIPNAPAAPAPPPEGQGVPPPPPLQAG